MAYICSECGVGVPTVSGLCMHLQIFHSKNVLNVFKCSQRGCHREYDSMRSFRKHLNKRHLHDIDHFEGEGRGENADEPDAPVAILQQVENINEVAGNAIVANDHVINNNIEDISVLDFKTLLCKSVLALTAKLYASPTLNRTQVQDTLDLVKEFACGSYLEVLKSKTMSVLQANNVEEAQVRGLSDMFNACSSMFDGFETEWQRIDLLEESHCYIRPTPYVIDVGEKLKRVDGNPVLAQVELKGQFISMKQTLKQYLELPGVFDAIILNLDCLNAADSLTNFVQGSLWKHIVETHFINKRVLPLFIYFDDVEPDSEIGSHSGDHKLGAVYYQIPCIPQHLVSSLQQIFLAAVFLSDDRSLNNGAAFAPVIDQLSDLEMNGIQIQTSSGEETVYFALGLLLGDNLGIHSVSGFVESFSANYYCRICKEHKTTMQTQFKENLGSLRNQINYDEDLGLNDVSLTGIKSRCIFNRLESYHVTENLVVDIMHDLFSNGVCHYVLCAILHHLIVDMNYFSLDTLNQRVQNFDYCRSGGKKPTLITLDHIMKEKLKMTASETMFFASHLGVFIGDLVPENEEVWKLYILQTQIIDILRAPIVRKDVTQYLATLISEHHELYCRIFNKNLKPKFHFMLHYPMIMLLLGPLIHVWSMRMEGKHRPVIKLTAANMTCRKNLPLTIAIKYALSLTSGFLSHKGFPKDIVYHSNEKLISDCENFMLFQNVLNPGFEDVFVFTQVEIRGTLYTQNMVVAFNYEDGLPLFGKIHWIVKPNEANPQPYFILSAFYTVGLNEHMHAYNVRVSHEWICVKQDELISYHPTKTCVGADGETYIVFPYTL